jgi:uncharacterized damage-inducible protein DinB
MTLVLTVDEFLGYSNEQRAIWESWLRDHPPAIATVWQLIAHLFLTEKRQTERMSGVTALTPSVGVAEPDVAGLFAFGRAARADLAAFIATLCDERACEPMEFHLPNGVYAVSPRKMIFNLLVHDVRHWAQIALIVRNAGMTPPGRHDLLHSAALA